MAHHLAQVNVARMLAPLDSPRMADFMAALEPVNALAEATPGFVWRLQTDDGDPRAAARRRGLDSRGIGSVGRWPGLAAVICCTHSADLTPQPEVNTQRRSVPSTRV